MRTRPTSATIAVVLLVCGVACYGVAAGCALVASKPTPDQAQALREDAVRIANATTTALQLVTHALTTADDLEKQHVITPAVLTDLAEDSKRFAAVARVGLTTLEQLTQPEANLQRTATAIISGLQPFLTRLRASGNQLLEVVATSIDIAVDAIRAYIWKGVPRVGAGNP